MLVLFDGVAFMIFEGFFFFFNVLVCLELLALVK